MAGTTQIKVEGTTQIKSWNFLRHVERSDALELEWGTDWLGALIESNLRSRAQTMIRWRMYDLRSWYVDTTFFLYL